MFYLEEAVLDVLYEVVHGDNDQETWLTTAKISKRLGIPAADTGLGYPLVRCILDKLLSEAPCPASLSAFNLTHVELKQ